MKKTALLISLISLAFASCKQTSKEAQKNTEAQTETQTVETEHHPDSEWVNEIVLNNGFKWQANQETTDGVVAMLALIGKSKLSSREDYKKLGDSLNEVKNTVVKECTMKGASHDNLHVWLHPLIEKIKLLQNTGSVEEGAKLTSNIKEHLEGYYEYFN
ncbi:hypothetical protein AB8P51_08680 [Muriicola sp. SD30]|uniref:hypothetical protein n=1 Tax=Muriicola sp. SD30 TaxID=3240936 RepID=UPI003510056B